MAIMPSEELRNLMFIVTGEWFPETDEDVAALRGLVMERTQGQVDILKGKVDESIAFVGDALPGDIGKNFIASMESVKPELDKLTEGMGKASGGLRKTAMDVREAKWNIIAELIRLAAEIAILTALAAVTGGASATQIAVRKLIARVRMLVILYELSNRIPLFSAITEAIEEALLTLATRLALMRWAPEGQRPSGVDGRDVGIAAVFGALTGAFSELFGAVVRKVTNAFNSFVDNWMKGPPTKKWDNDDLADGLLNTPRGNRWDDLPGGLPGDGPGTGIRRHAIDEIGQAPSEGAAETLAEGLVNEMFYGGFEVNPWTAVGAMVSRQVEMGLMSGGMAFGGALNNFFPFKDGLGAGLLGGSGGGLRGATGGSFGGTAGGASGATRNGERGNPGGGFGTEPGGASGAGFRTRTGDLDGFGGVGGFDGVHGLRGGNGADRAGGSDGFAGPGSAGGANGLRNPGGSVGLDTSDGLDGLRHHNAQSPLARFDDSRQADGPGPQRAPGFNLSSGSDQAPGPQPVPGSHLYSGAQPLPGARQVPGSGLSPQPGQVPGSEQPSGSPQLPGAHRSTGLDAVGNLDQRIPGQGPDGLGGRMPTSSGSLPDTEHEGHRQAPSGGAQQSQSQDQTRHRPTEEASRAGADRKLDAPRPQPETRNSSGRQPHNQPSTHTPVSPQAQPETRIPTSSHSQPQPETPQQSGSRSPSQPQPEAHTLGSPRPEQQSLTPASPQPQTHAPSSAPRPESSAETPSPAVVDGTAPDPVTVASPGPTGSDGRSGLPHTSADEALREQHSDAARRLSGALDSVQELRDRMDTGTGSNRDATLLDQALDDAARAEKELKSAENQLRDLGTDPHTLPPDRDHGPAPAVERDSGQRRWIAGQVTPEDLAPGVLGLNPSRTVDGEALDAAGILAPPALRAQWQLGSADVPLAESGLPPVDQARLLMVEPGPWPQALDVTAANTTRRLWQESYADFAAAAPQLAGGETRYTPSQAWSIATGLVLPLEMHPVRADSRHAAAPYRDAAREIADLLMAGGGPDDAASLADRLRDDLGLPPRADDDTPPADLPAPILTASASPGTEVPPAAVPPTSAFSSATPKPEQEAGEKESGPAGQEPRPEAETADPEPAPVVVPAAPRVVTSSQAASPPARQPAVLLAPPTASDIAPAPRAPADAGPRPAAPKRTNTMLSSASSSQDSDDVLTAEQAQDIKFQRDKSELYHRIAGIRVLAADPAFRKGVNDFLENIDRDRKSSTPSPVDHAAIDAIMTGLQQKGVYGNKIQYSWYHRHQDKEGFEGALEAHAKRAANHGALWSKMGSATATAEAGVGRGVVLEASIQGRMFDGLLFGLSSWSSSPALGVLWERLSKSYVESLTGWATAHVLDGTTNSSVLNRIEWPTLQSQIAGGKVDGLNIVVYRTVPDPDSGSLDLVPVDTFPVRTQEEFDQVPQAPGDAEWYRKQTRVDQEQRAALVEVYSREDQLDKLDKYVSDLLGKHEGKLAFRPTLTPHTTFRGSFSSGALADVAVRLPVVHPGQRALLIDALSPDERRTLAANEEVVNSLRAHLSPEEFAATEERLRGERPTSPTRQEAESAVSVPPWSSAALAEELSRVSAGERARHIGELSRKERHELLDDGEFVNGLRERLSPEEFAAAQAELMAEGAETPVANPAPVVAPAVPLAVTSSETASPPGAEPASSPAQQPDALFAPPTELDSLLAPPVPADADPIRDWRLISAAPNRLRSDTLRAVDEAVAGLPADPSANDVRPVLDAVREWKKDKNPQSGRWDAITRLESAAVDRIDRIQQLNTPERPAPVAPVVSVSVAARQHPVKADGYAPASGFEVELHRYRLELPAGHTYDECEEIVSVPGLLKITLDRAGGVPILELVTEPARGLANGRADGRAERSDVVRAFHDVVNRLENARPGSSLGSVFPADAGYRVDALAEHLPVKINDAGGDRMLVHHSASTPLAKAVSFLEHVGSSMRREPGPARTAHADLGLGLQFAQHGRTRFDSWLDQHPEHRSGLLSWDHDELEGALALGYAQAAGAVRGSLDRSRPPKDLTAVVSRGSLAGIRRGLGPVPRAFLEDQAKQLAAEFAASFDAADLPKDVGVLDRLLPPRADQGERATVGQYVDNLLRANPERPVDQREALLLRRTWPDLDANPEAGAARLEPAVAVVQVRLYAATDSTAATVESESDTLSELSFGLYKSARSGRGLPRVGRPLAPVGSRPPAAPRRTNTMLSSGSSSSSQGSMDTLTAEQAQDIKFLRDKSELYHRIAGIRPLAADPAFRKGVNDFLENIDRDRKSSTPTPVDHAAIDAIMTGLQRPGVYGNKIQYSWYHRHQDKEGFEEALEAHATQSADHGGLWSKMGSAIPTENAGVGHGVVLEASIQGRMFDGLLFGLSTWSSSPALGVLWERLSKSYVESLTGWATAHVLDGTTNSSVLNRIEWPTLRGQIEAGKVDGLNIVVYRTASNPDSGSLDLVPVDTFPVRTQEEFDQVPQAPGDAEWYRKQTRVDQEQRAALVKVYSRENQIDQLDAYVSDLLGKHGDNLTFRPTLTPHATFRGSFSSSVLADLAVGLPTADPGRRAALLRGLSPDERGMLATNEELVNSLREHLSAEDFAATAAGLMVDGPEPGDPASEARQEAETIVSGMLADPEVAVSLLTGGRRVVVVPRGVAVTALPQFAGLRDVEAAGRPVDLQRALYYDGLIAIGEENLLGEPTDVPGAGIQADGYGALRHELAHAIEEVLDPADRERIEDHYRAKSTEGEATRWPDGPGANYSASNPRDYFAQLTNTYLAVNTGTDLATGSPRNNGADWVREHDPKLLPLLERLYGPGRPGILGSQDNPYMLSGFRALFDRAERDLAGEPTMSESGSEPSSPEPEPTPAPRGRTGVDPDGGTLLAPPTQGGRLSRRLVEDMKRMFGRDIRRHPQFDALYDALALLNRLHEFDPGHARGSMDVGTTTERVLHLDPGVDITAEDYRNLLLTAASADRNGWATSIDSVAAYQTLRTTRVLGPETWTQDPHLRYTARNWSGNSGLHLDVDQIWTPSSQPGAPLVASPAPWGRGPHVVVVERDSDSHLIILRDAVGGVRYVDDGEFAVLVANDPDRPPNAPVLLLTQPPENAEPEAMPRLLADLAQIRVWSTDGQLRLLPAAGPSNVRLVTLVNRRPVLHNGVWFPSDPGMVPRSPGRQVRTMAGAVLNASDLESYPLVTTDGQSITGRAFLTSEDLVRMEAEMREVSAVTHYVNYDAGLPGVAPARYGPTLPLPRAVADSYVLVLHGSHGRPGATSRSGGGVHTLAEGELGRVLRRRPSLERMHPGTPVFAVACELARLRPGADRLADPPEMQDIATQTGRTAFATDAQTSVVADPNGGLPTLLFADDVDRPRHGIWEFRPEPDAETLRWIAEVAGLPPEVSMRSTRALRWVRALREVFDIDIDSDPGRQHEFTALIRDFGQLEMQRMAVGVGPEGTGPLTWRELIRITDDFARRAGYSGGLVTHTLLRDVLLAARHRTLRLPGLPNMLNILYAPPTQAHPTLPVAEEPPPVRIDTASADTIGGTGRGPSPAPPAALAPDTESSDGPDRRGDSSRADSPWDPDTLLPATVPPGTEAAYRRTLTDVLGQGVTADPGFSQWLAGAARLDLLRRTSADFVLRGGSLDLDAVARKVLSLAPDTPVTGSDYGNLFRIALDPRTADATGLATLAALNLVDRGALSREGELAAHDGTPYGRVWGASRPAPGQVVDVHEVATTLLDDDGTTRETDRRPSPWQPQPGGRPPFVLIAAGHARTIMVGLDDGSQAEAAQDVVTELLGMDPLLSGMPEDVPVLLVVPYAGEGGLELPRGIADGLGREVWSTSGAVHLSPRGDRIGISLLHEVDGQGDPVDPRGDFIRSRPGEVSAHDPADVPAWERNLVSFTVVSDEDGHPQVGRVYLDAADLARRERHARVVHRMNRLVRVLPGSDLAFPPVPISGGAAPGEKVHHLVLHHLPEAAAMPQEDGSTYHASPAETVRSLRRRPSVQRLGSRDWIYTFACWAGRAYDGPLPSPATNVAAVLPPVADPLSDHPPAQLLATGLGLRVKAADRPVVLSAQDANHSVPALRVITDSRGEGGQVKDFWPEPGPAELDRRARVAGLHTGPGPVPPHIRDRTLRLVHALRQGFDNLGIDGNPSYDVLLRGVGALELMWQADPDLGGMGLLTLDAFRMLSLWELRDHGQGRARVDADVVRSLLARAAAVPPGTRLSDFARLRPLVDTARELRSLGPLRETVTGVLRLDPSALVGEAEVQRVFWARVKAREWMARLTAPDAVAVRALHLSAPDPARRDDLGMLATRAIAAGRTPYDVDQLAAFHLEELGAFDPRTRLISAPSSDANGRTAGRDWAGRPALGQYLDPSALAVVEQRPDGSYDRTGEESAPWAVRGMLAPYVVAVADAGPGRAWLDLPGGRFAVPNTEVAELVSRDPDLIGRGLSGTDVVLAVRPADPAAGPPPSTQQLPLRLEVAKSTSREIWTAKGPAVITPSGVPGRLTVGSTPSAASAIPSAARDWSGTTPADTVPHSLARSVPQQPPVPGRQPAPLVPAEPSGLPTGAPDQPRSAPQDPGPAPAPERPGRPDTASGPVVVHGAPAADAPLPTPSATPSVLLAPPVRAAVPVRTSDRQDIGFVDGRAQLGEDSQRRIAGMAQRLVGAAVRDLSAGLRIPALKVTGYGDGARIAVGSGPARRTEGSGRLPARIVEDELRAQISAHLSTLPPAMLETVRRVRGRALTADDFPIDARSGTDPDPHPRPGVRRAVVEVQVSTLSRTVDRLARLLPALNFYSTDNSVLTLDQAPGVVLIRPLDAPAPSKPALAKDAARFDADAVPDHLRPLYDLVTEAMATGDADSVASLIALHLDRQGAFAKGTRLLAADGSVGGRNWTGHPGMLEGTAVSQRVPGSPTTAPSPTPWSAGTDTARPFVVGTASGGHSGAELVLSDRTRYRVSDHEFAELVRRDPDLSAADDKRPVVLASSRAGAGGLDLPRMSAFRTGRPVYAHTGRVELVPDGTASRLHISLSDLRNAKLPLGSWVLTLPDDWDASEPLAMAGDAVRTLDNRIVSMRDIESVTVTVGGRPAGRMLMNLDDQFNRESTGLDLAGFTEWVDVDPVSDQAIGAPHPVQWKGRKPYVLWMHGSPGVGSAPTNGSPPVPLSGTETGRYLKRRASFRRLGPEEPLIAVMCWAAAKPGAALGGFADDAPFVPDPWGTASFVQQISNELDRDFYGPSRVHVAGGPVGKPESGVYTNAEGVPGTFDLTRPEPTPEQLDRLSTVVGLDGVTVDPQDRRATALRLMRGLRELVGMEGKNDRENPSADYRALLSGLGAVETMRRADARLAARGEITPYLVERIVRAHTGTEPAPHTRPASVDPAHVRATLLAARTALDADPSAELSSFVTLPGVDRALELLTEDDEDERVRQVLRLAPDRPVTAGLKQLALWATVTAVEAVDGHPATEALVRQVLHLRPYESVDIDADGEELLWTAATAAAVGRNVYSPVALAVYHLQRGGVFAPDSALVSPAGQPVGRNWSSNSLTERFNPDLYTTTDPATGTRTSHPPLWNGAEKPFVIAVEPGSEPDTVSLPWLNGPPRSVPYDEFAELLRMDPTLRQIAPAVARLVVVGLDDSATQELTDLLGTRRALGRRVFVSRHPMDLAFDPQRHAHYLNLTTADPDPDQHWWDQPAERLPLSAQPSAASPVVNLAAAAEAGGTAHPTVLPDATDAAPTEPERAVAGVAHDWIEARLEAPGADRYVPRLAGADWAAGRTTAPLADLLAAGVTVTRDQYAYASLTGTLLLADVDVPLVQRYRLLRAWSGDDGPAVADIVGGLTTASHSVVVGAHSPDVAGASADPVLESFPALSLDPFEESEPDDEPRPLLSQDDDSDDDVPRPHSPRGAEASIDPTGTSGPAAHGQVTGVGASPESDEAADGLPAPAWALARIRYAQEALYFERRLAAHLAENPQINREFAKVVRAFWTIALQNQLNYRLFGSDSGEDGGAVGRRYDDLVRVVESGNLRERVTFLFNGVASNLVPYLMGGVEPQHPVIGIERRDRHPSEQMKRYEREMIELQEAELDPEDEAQELEELEAMLRTPLRPHEVWPALSPAERRLAVRDGVLLWSPAGQLHTLPMAADFQARSEDSGGLVLTGTSGSAYRIITHVARLTRLANVPVDLGLIRSGLVSILVGVGHHSFHEVMTGAQHALNEIDPFATTLYSDNWGRYWDVVPLTEEELRTYVAREGRFPDEHAGAQLALLEGRERPGATEGRQRGET